jgi:hypothetical protein
VCGHELLLLVQHIEEAKRVRAEPYDRHDRQHHKRPARARRHTHALAPA